MERAGFNCKKDILNFKSILPGLVVFIVLGVCLGFRGQGNHASTNIQSGDTLVFYAEDFSNKELILIDSISKTNISLDNYLISYVLHKNNLTNKGTELAYERDQCLAYKANVVWIPDEISPRWINEYYMGDFELLGARVEEFLYEGEFYMYEDKNKPLIIQYHNGSIIR